MHYIHVMAECDLFINLRCYEAQRDAFRNNDKEDKDKSRKCEFSPFNNNL